MYLDVQKVPTAKVRQVNFGIFAVLVQQPRLKTGQTPSVEMSKWRSYIYEKSGEWDIYKEGIHENNNIYLREVWRMGYI